MQKNRKNSRGKIKNTFLSIAVIAVLTVIIVLIVLFKQITEDYTYCEKMADKLVGKNVPVPPTEEEKKEGIMPSKYYRILKQCDYEH
jgi:hypothetical protein